MSPVSCWVESDRPSRNRVCVVDVDTLEPMRWTTRLALIVGLMLVPVVAGAQDAGEIADSVERRGYFVEDGTAPINAMEELAVRYPSMGFVGLAVDVDDADFLAEDVLARTGVRDTVVVLTPTQVGVASATIDTSTIDEALDAAFASAGDSYETDFREFAEALESAGSGGFSVWWLVLGGVGLVGFLMWRGSRRDAETVERRLEQARAEITAQMSVIADQILELSDRVDLSDDAGAEAHYRRGSEIFSEAEPRLDSAVTHLHLEELSDDLDDARWELAAAEALLNGEDPPPPPPEDERPAPCFFDPTHGAGVETATLETAAGAREVLVCRADAERLRRGERPAPRTIDVGRRRIPAPQAPRSHGGSGLDWLDVFSVVVGGMGDGARYDWNPRAGGRGGLGGLGSGFPSVGRRPGGSRPVSRPSRPSRPARAVRGRGRRSR